MQCLRTYTSYMNEKQYLIAYNTQIIPVNAYLHINFNINKYI